MTAEQLIKLVDAGFTKDEISKMFGDPEQKAQEQKTPEKQKEDAAPDKQKAPEPEKQKEDPWKEVLSGVVKEIGEIKMLIQSGNTRKETGTSEQTTVDDILATFINPNKGGKENA